MLVFIILTAALVSQCFDIMCYVGNMTASMASLIIGTIMGGDTRKDTSRNGSSLAPSCTLKAHLESLLLSNPLDDKLFEDLHLASYSGQIQKLDDTCFGVMIGVTEKVFDASNESAAANKRRDVIVTPLVNDISQSHFASIAALHRYVSKIMEKDYPTDKIMSLSMFEKQVLILL